MKHFVLLMIFAASILNAEAQFDPKNKKQASPSQKKTVADSLTKKKSEKEKAPEALPAGGFHVAQINKGDNATNEKAQKAQTSKGFLPKPGKETPAVLIEDPAKQKKKPTRS